MYVYIEGRNPPEQTKFEQATRAALHKGDRAPLRKVGLDYSDSITHQYTAWRRVVELQPAWSIEIKNCTLILAQLESLCCTGLLTTLLPLISI